jgi:hypothetical protein
LNFIDKYENPLFYGLVILLIGAISFGLHIFLNLGWDLIIGSIFLGLIVTILGSLTRIKFWFTNFKKNLEKRNLK